MEQSFNLSKEFLNNFPKNFDFDYLTEKLSQISAAICKEHGCNKKITINFDYCPVFAKIGNVNNNHIAFNKTRLQILQELKIDDTSIDHMVKVKHFYNTYGQNKKHSDYEQSLYKFIENCITNGTWQYIAKMGSYKTVKYELLEAIYHENRHIMQNQYTKYILNPEQCPVDDASMILVFTMAFTKIYQKLLNSNVQFNYKRENHTFPIEIDANYHAIKMLNQLKNQHCCDDKLFSVYLSSNSYLPENLDIKNTVNNIFKDYQNLYKSAQMSGLSDFVAVNDFITKNKQQIMNVLCNRYQEMQEIIKQNKNEVSKGNQSTSNV